MELANEFQVPVPGDEAWSVLTDIERIAPCMPGAQLEEVTGDEYHGAVKVKVGPITATYKGTARFVERDDIEHRAVLQAEGRDTRGQGNASATITAQLSPSPNGDGSSTNVTVVTDLKVSGRIAQFGRGVLADVSSKLLTQFAECLEKELQDGDATDTTAAAGTSGSGEGTDREAAEPVDLLETAGAPVAKRMVPIGVAVTTALWLMSIFLRRRRRRRRNQ